MTSSARGTAVYNAIAGLSPNFAKLSAAEQSALQTQIQTIFGADLTYVTTNAQVNPASLAALAGIPVATAGSPTAQTGRDNRARAAYRARDDKLMQKGVLPSLICLST